MDQHAVSLTSSQRGAHQRTLKVLVIDDELDAANSLALLLRMHGCKAVVSFGGDSGLRMARLFQPDLAIIDLAPGLGGMDVTRELRAHFGSATVLVALTGRREPDDEVRCAQAGFDRFFVKPLPADVLAELLEDCQG